MDARKRYSDIFDLPHHVSKKRPQMNRLNRAAQFAPFAALTGYDDLITETARQTDQRVELDEAQKDELDRDLRYLREHNESAVFTFFVPDERKDGGRYVTAQGRILKYDPIARALLLDTDEVILLDDLREIEY
jgi:hypothetical protein